MSKYFDQKVDEAIVKFQKEENLKEKHKIFVTDIKPAFEKLVNYHYFRLPVSRNPEVMHDCMSFLYEQIHKFDSAKYSRGFPYFNFIAKNFFIGRLHQEKRNVCDSVTVDSFIDSQEASNDYFVEDLDEKIEKNEFETILLQNLYKWRELFVKEQEKKVVDSLIELFENIDNLENLNKKMIMVYLREMTGMSSKQISSNLSKIKKKFAMFKRKYNRGDI